MKYTVNPVLALLILLFTNAYADNDRIEKPYAYSFLFSNGDSLNLNNPGDSLLRSTDDAIINHKRELLQVKLSFKTGEKITFNYEKGRLVKIRIASQGKVLEVPKSETDKLGEIHFQTFTLLWNAKFNTAFLSEYFYFQFDMGREKYFEEYPYVQLNFVNKKYTKSLLFKMVSENALQREDF